MRYRYVTSLFTFLSKRESNRCAVSNFRTQSLCDVGANGVSVIDFCIVCARKIGRAELARRIHGDTTCVPSAAQLPEITFSRRAFRNNVPFLS